MLQIDDVKIGAIQTDSITEKGVVMDCGSEAPDIWNGKTIYFKAWAVDIITDGEQKYYFIDFDSEAICAAME